PEPDGVKAGAASAPGSPAPESPREVPMSGSEPVRDRGSVGLLSAARGRRPVRRPPMIVSKPRSIGSDARTLLVVAYADAATDGPGAEARASGALAGLLGGAATGEEELRQALGRLRAVGLVSERGGTFRPSEPVAAFLRARTHRRGVGHDLRDLARFLDT